MCEGAEKQNPKWHCHLWSQSAAIDSSIHTSAVKSPTPLSPTIYKETLAISYKVRNLFAIALPGYHATLSTLLQAKFTDQMLRPPLFSPAITLAIHIISFNAF